MSERPLEPDNIRTPGELPRLMNYAKFRYITICGDVRCAREIHFDQLPPTVCMHGRRYFLDREYEAVKRITADNPTGAVRPLVSTPTKPETVIDYTKLDPPSKAVPESSNESEAPTSPQPQSKEPPQPPAPEPPDDPILAEIFGP